MIWFKSQLRYPLSLWPLATLFNFPEPHFSYVKNGFNDKYLLQVVKRIK